jgi:hypothetical protein
MVAVDEVSPEEVCVIGKPNRNGLGGPGSPERTWAEDDVFRLLFLIPPWGCRSTPQKAMMGFARLFRPTYALANVGHPSRSYPLLRCLAQREFRRL